MNEDDQLNDLLDADPVRDGAGDNPGETANSPRSRRDDDDWGVEPTNGSDRGDNFEFRQWQIGANDIFRPAGLTRQTIPPGVYTFDRDDYGLFAKRIKVITDSLVELPDNASERVIKGIEKFWSMEDRYRKHGLLYKRGVLLWGPPGCHTKGTKIVMYDGSLKNVEDILVGDLLMGPDNKPRRVLELRQGKDEMYKIHPTKGDPFEVNGHHILSLVRSKKRDKRYPTVLNTSVN